MYSQDRTLYYISHGKILQLFRESITKEVKFVTSFYEYSNYIHIYVAALYFLEAVTLLLLLHATFAVISEGM